MAREIGLRRVVSGTVGRMGDRTGRR